MKNLIIRITLLMFFFYGCTDVLEKYPLDVPSQETFWTNESEIEKGINACYRFLQEVQTQYYQYPLVLDQFTNSGFIRSELDNAMQIALGDHDSKTGTIFNTWSRAYQGIGRCNVMLKTINEKASLLTDAQFKQFKGEALFLRAFYYMRLLIYFGDVPLFTSPVETIAEGRNATRTPKDEVYRQIMDDFTEAAGLLEVRYTDAKDKGRATRGAANAYKARMALYYGKYDVAAAAAGAVIESGVYQLYPKYGNLFVSTGLWDAENREVIFQREYNALTNYHELPRDLQGRMPTGGTANLVPTQQMVDSYHCLDGKNIAESSLFDKANPFENRDPRLKLSIVTPGSRFGVYSMEAHIDSTRCWNYTTNTRVTNGNCYVASPAAVSHTGYWWRKYSDETYVTKRQQADYPIILCRYAEVLLTYAEAKIESGQIDQSVIDAINSIRRDRVDVKMPEYTLADFADPNVAKLKVRHERKIELAFEGFRYHDLRRWGWADTYCNQPALGRAFKGSYSEWPDVTFDTNGEPVYDYTKYRAFTEYPDYRVIQYRKFTPGKNELWPIPERDILLNSGLKQNPGY